MRKFGEDEEAVSVVIGAVLMVGMTVIMVSIIAVSVYGFSIPESAPQAKIVVVEAEGKIGTIALHDNFIVLKHKGGDALIKNYTRIIITGKGYTYNTGTDPYKTTPEDLRVTYKDLTGENFVERYDGEIVNGNSWDAGETITLYGSDGRDLDYSDKRNTVDYKWKLHAGSTVLVTVIDTPSNQVIANSRAIVKQAS